MKKSGKHIDIRPLPVSWWLIWVGALLFTLFAVLQSYTTALQSGTAFPARQVFSFWPLNYFIWALLVPLIFTSYFLPKGKKAISIIAHIGIGLFWACLHYVVVSLLNGVLLNVSSAKDPSIDLFEYIIYYFPTSILSHCLDYLLITGILLILDFYRKNYQNQLAIIQLEKQLKTTQLDALKMQLNPHFFFNTLNTIASFMGKNEKGQEVIGTLARLLRAVMKEEKHQMIPLRKEMEYIRDYLSIEELRFEDRLLVKYDIEEETLQAAVPIFVLQPLVENAIKHGLVDQSEKGQLFISSHKENEELVLTVFDNGVGSALTQSEMFTKSGLGLNNVRQRLAYLYGDHQQMDILTEPGEGFTVKLTIPFNTLLQDQKTSYYAR